MVTEGGLSLVVYVYEVSEVTVVLRMAKEAAAAQLWPPLRLPRRRSSVARRHHLDAA